MRNIKLTIEYDGTSYHGWQSQINALAVQDVIKKAIKKLTGEDCNLIGSSRTDTGVHAIGQCANFFTASSIPPDKFSYALNNLLPEDIVIRHSEEVSKDFHARFSAKGKKYRYLIHNSVFPSALMRNRAYHVHYPLDLDSMKKAAGYFLGKHDFSAFKASGGSEKTCERTIYGASLNIDKGTVLLSAEGRQKNRPLVYPHDAMIEFEITGNGFLYNMVRIIVGTLVYVGIGKIRAEDIPDIIESRDRTRAGITAPAQGLYLVEVYY
ncbi:MAG: tRNA pseudouridine(38-40) synthase TruA [Clostridiales bacterium]|nr:tRNA pseudouridine(38-40) synthase TruA [Eubacteriales bacterium]MDH7566925.1 tRNA pseudouridine(38-40) synthase TruA [Clostridiales bacterium]